MFDDKDTTRQPTSVNQPDHGSAGETLAAPDSKSQGHSRLRYLAYIVTIVVVGMLLGTALVLRTLSNRTKDLTDRAAKALDGAFTRNVTHEFIASAPELPHRDLLEGVVREWTPVFSRKAKSEEYVGLIRELGRRQIGLFVRSWAQLQQGASPGAKILVEVRFRDELAVDPSDPSGQHELETKANVTGPEDI